MASLDAYRDTPVLVTGGDGFIGSHLVERLAAAGARVTALAQYNAFDSHGWLDDLSAETLARVRLVRGDVRDAALTGRLCADQRIVFHLAALIGIPYSYDAPQSYVDVNVTGTVNMLEAARAHGPDRIVVTSTSEVYGSALSEPIGEDHPLHGQSPYSASKIAADMMAEAYARSFELPVVILRPFNTYGPRQSERAVIPTVIRQALDPDCAAIRLGDTETRRDFTYVGDMIDAFLRAGVSAGLDPGRPYNAGSGDSVTIGAMAETVRRLAGTDKPIERDAGRMRPEASEVRVLRADASRFAATGWRPETSLEQGLAHTIEWWRARLAGGRVRPGADYMV